MPVNPAYLGRTVLLAVLVTVVCLLAVWPPAEWIGELIEWVRRHAVAGPIAYVAFVALGTVLFLPGSVATMIAGFLFGMLPGILFAAIAIPLGAQCAFEVARWIARPWVREKLSNSSRLSSIEVALQEKAFVIVVLTRLSLIIPFNLLNYAYGAMSVGARTHFVATAVGMLPAIGLYVYLGSLARNVEQIVSGNATPSAMRYWILSAGIAALATAIWVIHRAASRSLEKYLVTKEKVDSI